MRDSFIWGIGYLLVINLLLFAMMGIDKRRAQRHEWRIPEAQLWFLGLAGGGMGGYLGMQVFRHKTKKPIFYLIYFIGIVVGFVVLYNFLK